MNTIRCILLLVVSMYVFTSTAQDDLLGQLSNEAKSPKQLTVATFKSTRVINSQTVETISKNCMDFRISHRFGPFSSGAYNFWGLDGPANIRISFDYGITNKLMIGIGRSSYQKLFDGFIKYKILSQTEDNSMPITMTGLVTMNITSEKDLTKAVTGIDKYEHFSSRISYMSQLIVARKFNKKLSLQISPTMIHYNQVQFTTDKNNIYAMGTAARYKITRSLALSAEYIIRVSKYSANQQLYHNSLGFGLDVETGGHVFQLFINNSFGINEVQAIPFTTSSWANNEIRLGFNVSRVFSFNHNK